MPPRGVKKGTKDARKHEHIKKSEKQAGRSEKSQWVTAPETIGCGSAGAGHR